MRKAKGRADGKHCFGFLWLKELAFTADCFLPLQWSLLVGVDFHHSELFDVDDAAKSLENDDEVEVEANGDSEEEHVKPQRMDDLQGGEDDGSGQGPLTDEVHHHEGHKSRNWEQRNWQSPFQAPSKG